MLVLQFKPGTSTFQLLAWGTLPHPRVIATSQPVYTRVTRDLRVALAHEVEHIHLQLLGQVGVETHVPVGGGPDGGREGIKFRLGHDVRREKPGETRGNPGTDGT